ncbi:4-amino-4-deoxy-L-arabinose-phosphoundecaprenol flippase subunit ArnE [Sodalis sp. (in: enterobacteria)]|uniref:4-amino-4-deoxy-L-arabinose-phosphoundecaprenol flippase subunit ArnE n=1 Tax=Sodalis sp. (in: enterobacteria) TaxID=1898979 RepID=UPI003F391472
MIYLLIFLVSLLSCAGQLCQKHAASAVPGAVRLRHRVRWLATSLLLLGVAMLVWLWVLQRVPVGIAYPMFSLNFVLMTLAARWLWREPLEWRHGIGLLLIVAGVMVMGVNL